MKTQSTHQSLPYHTSLSCNHQQSPIPKCPAANPATLVCSSKICHKLAFICHHKTCQCYSNHHKCPHLSIQSLINTLKAKIIPSQLFQQSIFQKIDQTIDDLSALRDNLQILIKQNLTLYGLTQKDKNLYNALNSQNITGKQIMEFFYLSLYQVSAFSEQQPLHKKFESLWQTIDNEIKVKSNEFVQSLLFENKKEENKRKDQSFDLQLFKGTKIKISAKDQKNLLKMFGEKVIKSAKFLYRASQNNFQAQKFHQKCDYIPHTLTLCETIWDKVIGGYTPLLWNCQNGIKLKDQSGESFIFSLTNNHKFTLDKSKFAIYPYSNLGPAFGSGCPDFYINNGANNLNYSHAQLNSSYFNQNYKGGDGNSYLKFTGNEQKNFHYTAKEWQVWQLQFA